MYEKALGQLGDHFRAFAMDTPGYGQSDPPPRPLTIPEYADRSLAFLDAIGAERCNLLGHHTGASIAVDLASRNPDRVERLILGGVPLYSASDARRAEGKVRAPIEYTPEGTHIQWAWDRYRNMMGLGAPLERVQRGMLQLLIAGDYYPWAYEAVWDYDIEPALRRIRQPVLLLVGENDVLAPVNPDVVKIVPQAIDARIAGADAMLPDEETERYVAKIVEFVGQPGSGGPLEPLPGGTTSVLGLTHMR